MTAKYTLAIKGNHSQCQRALDAHRVTAEFVKAVPHRIGTKPLLMFAADETTTHWQLASWFNEAPDDPPFPASTLMWYVEIKAVASAASSKHATTGE